ncbi:4100_t:CDS:1, partial [Gigaspora rosea]
WVKISLQYDRTNITGAFSLFRALCPIFYQNFASAWLCVEVVSAPFFFSK